MSASVKPVVTPSLPSGMPKRASSVAMHTSQAVASSQPPPTASPRTAAMTGIGIVVNALRQTARLSLYSAASAALMRVFGNSLMSAPAANALSPAPRSTTARSPDSPARSSSSRFSRRQLARLSAFCACGWLSVINATFRWRCSATRSTTPSAGGCSRINWHISASMSPPHGLLASSIFVIARRLMVPTCAASRVLWQHPVSIKTCLSYQPGHRRGRA